MHTPAKNSDDLLRKLSIVTLIASFLGGVLNASLAIHYFDIHSGSAALKSFCNLGTAFNCDAVAASRFAEVVSGIPIAGVAAGWFLAALILAIMTLQTEWRKLAYTWLCRWSLAGSVVCAGFIGVMAFVLHTFCLQCLIQDGLVFLIFAIAWFANSKTGAKNAEKFATTTATRSQTKVILATLGASVIAVPLIFFIFFGASQTEIPANTLVSSIVSSGPLPVNAGPEFPTLGNKNAPITVVEFSDFQCPYCKRGAQLLNSVLNRFPDDVKVVFRNYPLDPSCNTKMKSGGHTASCEAARAAYCAHKLGQFNAVYETFFERQSELAPKKVTEFANAVITPQSQNDFAQCLASSETQAWVGRDLEEGDHLGVQSTPTFFVNGYKVEGLLPMEAWGLLIKTLKEIPKAPGN